MKGYSAEFVRPSATRIGLNLALDAVVTTTFRLIGRGVYSLHDAERLTGVQRKRIRRWTSGYSYRSGLRYIYSPPVIAEAAQGAIGLPALDFGDLIEVRFLNAFRNYGVSWKAIRIAAEHARELLGRHHPFSSRIFKTDGRTILADVIGDGGDRFLLDLVRNQYEFERIICPLLYEGIEFNGHDEPERWWPLGTERAVVLDPIRAFGAPITAVEGVPTRILADAVAAEGSVPFVSELYDVARSSVEDALEFESRLGA